ncbi:hypothetical protein T459_17520 [Capsicum annuum]|uniref:Protein kinase domain-containing protein n=1 Tax=Capsicum annuum TaxID=4072 RepID=A0A2G2ZBU5_CAPAN|nr:hypothetical protein T459_17520 [Capsicum annuum]
MMYNGKSHHIRRRHNTGTKFLSSEIITVDYVKSKDNVSDPLTKDLSREGVERTSKGMGLSPRTSQHGEHKDPFDQDNIVNITVLEDPMMYTAQSDPQRLTNNFAPDNELGRDNFGVVYKGLIEDGIQIAVKRRESTIINSKALEEFQAKIVVLSKVRHLHLVSLLGFSIKGNERLLNRKKLEDSIINVLEHPKMYIANSRNLVISTQYLWRVTNNFVTENGLGHGGFGVVYKGVTEDESQIIVKRIESSIINHKKLDKFQVELDMISKVLQCHLVSLLGYSVEGNERLLVYEFMSKGALSRHLFRWKILNLELLSQKRKSILL